MLDHQFSNKSLENLLASYVPEDLLFSLGFDPREQCHWIGLALLHRSYINENLTSFDLKQDPLFKLQEILSEIGFAYGSLALHHLAYLNPNLKSIGKTVEYCSSIGQDLFYAIALNLHVSEYVLLGRGELPNSLSKQILISVGKRLLGVISQFLDYQAVFKICKNAEESWNLQNSEIKFQYKTELQNFAQQKRLGIPHYRVIRETGPNHAKVFTVEVETKDGKSALGEGRSKKLAQSRAAKNYLEFHLPLYLKKRNEEEKKPSHSPHLIPDAHLQSVNNIASKFNISGKNYALISQALIHSSYTNEAKSLNVQDYRQLSQLGSIVLHAFVVEALITEYLDSIHKVDVSVQNIVGNFENTTNIALAFDLFNVEHGLLLGKGQRDNGLTLNIKADIVQSIFAVLFLEAGSLTLIHSYLPNEVKRWVKISMTHFLLTDDVLDPKGYLQEYLQAIKINWQYEEVFVGTPQNPRYLSQLRLKSLPTRKTFTVKGVSQPSKQKKEAERFVALQTVRLLDLINYKIVNYPDHELYNDGRLQRFARFILLHQLNCLPDSLSATKSWYFLGLMGTKLLATKKMLAFNTWAKFVDTLFEENNSVGNFSPQIEAFFTNLYTFLSVDNYAHLLEGLSDISSFVENLNPENSIVDVRESKTFETLVILTKISKILSKKYVSTSLENIVEGFQLLRRGRKPKINLSATIPELVIFEREGFFLSMLEEAINSISRAKLVDNDEVSLKVSFFLENNILEFKFALELNFEVVRKLEVLLHNNPLWQFFEDEAPIIDWHVTSNYIIIRCGISLNENSECFFFQSINAVLKGKQENINQFESVSRLLHDLKNQLVAYQVAVDSPDINRTSRYRKYFIAGQHLDAAMSICSLLASLTDALAVPELSYIDVELFLRQYCATKLSTLPSGIRLVPPSNTQTCSIYSSIFFLNAIIENLTKNSVEALRGGGEIVIDWVFDDPENKLLIEIADNGPGVPEEILQDIMAKKATSSMKPGGIGVGILSVHAMLDRLHGKLLVNSQLGIGTNWYIEIPSLDDFNEKTTLGGTPQDEDLLLEDGVDL